MRVERNMLMRLHERDNVAIIVRPIEAGQSLAFEGESYLAPRDLGIGHKIAVRHVAEGSEVLKYGAPIGVARLAIVPGDHVHLHNLASRYTAIVDIDGSNA